MRRQLSRGETWQKESLRDLQNRRAWLIEHHARTRSHASLRDLQLVTAALLRRELCSNAD
jgi:hypothetical protein